jgi:protocatechuate 3,4-dioxygenase beta subunit
MLGPFYPVPTPEDAGADLFHRSATSPAPIAASIEITGRVLSVNGTPVRDALVEIWQANTVGRYVHVHDTSDNPLEPDFRGYGRDRTGDDGRYRFLTVVPGPYHDGQEWRAPHVHFQVTGPTDRLITQLFFANEPMHRTDWLFQRSRRPHMLEAPLIPTPGGGRSVTWDIFLGGA